jgi:hypothetical protein
MERNSRSRPQEASLQTAMPTLLRRLQGPMPVAPSPSQALSKGPLVIAATESSHALFGLASGVKALVLVLSLTFQLLLQLLLSFMKLAFQ